MNPAESAPVEVSISDILVEECQTRWAQDEKAIEHYAECMEEGDIFPPIVLFKGDGRFYCIGDGHHRLNAAIKIARKTILAIVHKSEDPKRDATIYACGANALHGVRTTRQDKQKAIDILLDDPEWRDKSNREIGRKVRCSHHTVKTRREMGGQLPTHSSPVSCHEIAVNDPRRVKYQEIDKELSDVGSWIEKKAADPDLGGHMRLIVTRLTNELQSLRKRIRQLEPAICCPVCKGEGCKQCLYTGFLTVEHTKKRAEYEPKPKQLTNPAGE